MIMTASVHTEKNEDMQCVVRYNVEEFCLLVFNITTVPKFLLSVAVSPCIYSATWKMRIMRKQCTHETC